MKKQLFFLILSVFLMIGCGPEETTKDSRDRESKEEIAEKTKIYRQFEGDYRGSMVTTNDAVIGMRLSLSVFNIYVPNPNTNKIEEVANMIGTLFRCEGGQVKDKEGWRIQDCKNGNWIVLADFDIGKFNDEVTYLFMTGLTQQSHVQAKLALGRTETGFEGDYVGGVKADIKLTRENQ